MKRLLVLAVVVFVLALMVSSVSAGGKATPVIFSEVAESDDTVTVDTIKPNPPIPTNKASRMDESVSAEGGKATPVIFSVAAESDDIVTMGAIKPDPIISK